MKWRILFSSGFAVMLSAVAHANSDAQKVTPQSPYNGRERNATPPRAVGRLPHLVPSTGTYLVVHLDNTGVTDWRFINPRRAAKLDPGVGLQFRNDTSGRTFVVSTTASLKTAELAVRFPVLTRPPLATLEGERMIIAALSSDPARFGGNPDLASYGAEIALLEHIDSVARVRELFNDLTIDPAKAADPFGDTTLPSAIVTVDAQGAIVVADKLPDALKPLVDRLKALEARRRELATRLAVGQQPALSTNASAHVAVRSDDLAKAYEQLAKLASELADAPSSMSKKREVAEQMKKIEQIESLIAEGAVKADAAAAAAPLSDEEKLLEVAETEAILKEVDRIASDRPRLLAAIAQFHTLLTQPDLDNTPPKSPQRALRAKQAVLEGLSAELKTLVAARKVAVDDRISALQNADERERRNLRTWLRSTDRDKAAEIDARIEARNQVLLDLGRQAVTDADTAMAARFPGADISQCAQTDGTLTCIASQLVPPDQTAIFSASFIAAIAPPDTVFKFQVRFFDEVDVPANDTVYLTTSDNPKPPPNSFALGLVGSVGQKRDPAVAAPTDASPCATLVCTDGHKNHFSGSGQVQLKQRVADYFEGSATVTFKDGDLGVFDPTKDVNKDQTVSFSRYKFSVFSDVGISLDFGKFPFATPTNGIAINESGEGFRIVASPFFTSFSYLIKRESGAFLADRANRDSWSFIVQTNSIPLSSAGPFRTLNAAFVRGFDRRFIDPQTSSKLPYDYKTYGGELGYAIPVVHLNGVAGYYSSERHADDNTTDCLKGPCNGSGRVGMLTMTRSFGLDKKNKPQRSVTLTFARGSGDNPKTKNFDEGYVGETGGFAPDVIFLKTLVKPFNAASDPTNVTSSLPLRLGSGLSNKSYFGVQYVENTFSPLYTLAHDVFRINDISSYSTTIRYNDYRLRRGFDGQRSAGHEIDVELLLESPKGVKTTLGGGYYRPGSAVSNFVKKNLWSVYSNVNVSFTP
jgi:hypothetical protein